MTDIYEIVIARTSPTRAWCGDQYLGFAKSEDKAHEFARAEQKRIAQDPNWRTAYSQNRVMDLPEVRVRLCQAKLIDD